MDLAALQNGEALAHHRHGALIEVAKRLGPRFTAQAPANQLSGVASLLQCDLRDTW